MTNRSMSAREALRAYEIKDENLFDQLRTMWLWNDVEFQELVRIATRCLEDNRAGRTLEETRAYFAPRQEILERLVSWMSDGRCPYPAEHFVLPEWQVNTEG